MHTAASIAAIPAVRPRWYRSVGAVLAGLLVNTFLSSATDMLLVAIGVIVGTLGAIAAWEAWTHWYSLAIIAVTLPSSWLGARIYLARR